MGASKRRRQLLFHLVALISTVRSLTFTPQSSILSASRCQVASAGSIRHAVSLPTRRGSCSAPKSNHLLLKSSATDEPVTSNKDESDNVEPDYGQVAKYVVATGLQFSLLAGALKLVDILASRSNRKLPVPAVGAMFVFLSLRSRVASLLDNSRPNRDAMDGKATPSNVKRPSWTPPGIAFPFIWLTITLLRGISSALVYSEVGVLSCRPLLAMILHLCIGDTWNTITNVEQRLGVSAVVCLLVWASVWNAIYQYYKVTHMAGFVLAPSGVWISVATVLTWSIWRLNTPLQPLYPAKGDGKSASFKWKNLGQLEPTSIRGGN